MYDKRSASIRLGMTYNDANLAAYQHSVDNAGPITVGAGGGGIRGPNGDNYSTRTSRSTSRVRTRCPRGSRS
jgi:hypothetical protein